MFQSNQKIPDNQENQWRFQLDKFVKDYQQQLAALSWRLWQEWGEDSNDVLGIDLKPKPHFVACSRQAIERLNYQINGQIQEILGLLDGCDRHKEVMIIVIAEGQVKLINFQPSVSLAICSEQIEQNLDNLIVSLEENLSEYLH